LIRLPFRSEGRPGSPPYRGLAVGWPRRYQFNPLPGARVGVGYTRLFEDKTSASEVVAQDTRLLSVDDRRGGTAVLVALTVPEAEPVIGAEVDGLIALWCWIPGDDWVVR